MLHLGHGGTHYITINWETLEFAYVEVLHILRLRWGNPLTGIRIILDKFPRAIDPLNQYELMADISCLWSVWVSDHRDLGTQQLSMLFSGALRRRDDCLSHNDNLEVENTGCILPVKWGCPF